MAMKIVETLLPNSVFKNRDTWNLHYFSTVKRMVFISWKLPSSTFLKINFDSNITSRVGFNIQDLNSRLIATKGIRLVGTKFIIAWKSITYNRLVLRTDHLIEIDLMLMVN